MYLNDVAKSPKDPTLAAILRVVFATYGAAIHPIDTAPYDSSTYIDASPYSRASNGIVFKPIDTWRIVVPACLAKSPMNGADFIPTKKDLQWLITNTAF